MSSILQRSLLLMVLFGGISVLHAQYAVGTSSVVVAGNNVVASASIVPDPIAATWYQKAQFEVTGAQLVHGGNSVQFASPYSYTDAYNTRTAYTSSVSYSTPYDRSTAYTLTANYGGILQFYTYTNGFPAYYYDPCLFSSNWGVSTYIDTHSWSGGTNSPSLNNVVTVSGWSFGSTQSSLLPITVSVSPNNPSLGGGQSQSFIASVSGGPSGRSNAVTWSLSGPGSLSSTGTYTAPAGLISSGSYAYVTATSVADTTKSGTATVYISPISVAVSPASVTVNAGMSQQFTANVNYGANTAVTWSVVNSTGTVVTTSGTVTSGGFYSAPTTPGTYYVRATSAADTSKWAQSTVTVPSVAVAISPTAIGLNQGATQQFAATVTGASNTGVTWSVVNASGSVITDGGTINTGGLYTAPTKGGTYYVRATSVADTTKWAQSSVTVPNSLTVRITKPVNNQYVSNGGTITCVASATDSDPNATLTYEWEINGEIVEGQQISYPLPSWPGFIPQSQAKILSITVTVTDSSGISATATINVRQWGYSVN